MALTRSFGAAVVRLQSVRQQVGEVRLRFVGQAALAGWFAYWTYIRISSLVSGNYPIGMDVQIYYRGVQPGSTAAIRGRQASS